MHFYKTKLMMKKVIFSTLLFMLFIAQMSAQSLPNEEITVGKFLDNDSLIKGIKYTLPDRIYKFYCDSLGRNISAQLRGIKNDKWYNNTGLLVQLNLPKNIIQWSQKMNYTGQSVLYSDSLVLKYNGNISALNPRNGKEKWTNTAGIFQIDKLNNVGLGFGMINTERLYGVNLTTGEDVWSRKIPRDFGWNGGVHLTDSTILVLAHGLHTINLKNGEGWDFEMKTGEKDYSGAVAANIAGVALGLLTGTFMFSTGHSTVTEVASNGLVNNARIYFASKNKLGCFDFEGEHIWMTTLPKDSMSKSLIFIRQDTLYMVNQGYAFFDGKLIPFGVPFIAAYGRKSGLQLYLKTLEKGVIISDFKVFNADNSIVLLTKDKLYKFNLKDGNLINDLQINNSVDDPLTYFVGNHIYQKNQDSTFQSMNLVDTTNIIVASEKKGIITFDSQFKTLKDQSIDELFVLKKELNNSIFIKGKNELIILKNNKINAIIKGNYELYFTKNKLFLTKDNELIALNLSDFN